MKQLTMTYWKQSMILTAILEWADGSPSWKILLFEFRCNNRSGISLFRSVTEIWRMKFSPYFYLPHPSDSKLLRSRYGVVSSSYPNVIGDQVDLLILVKKTRRHTPLPNSFSKLAKKAECNVRCNYTCCCICDSRTITVFCSI